MSFDINADYYEFLLQTNINIIYKYKVCVRKNIQGDPNRLKRALIFLQH